MTQKKLMLSGKYVLFKYRVVFKIRNKIRLLTGAECQSCWMWWQKHKLRTVAVESKLDYMTRRPIAVTTKICTRCGVEQETIYRY